MIAAQSIYYVLLPVLLMASKSQTNKPFAVVFFFLSYNPILLSSLSLYIASLCVETLTQLRKCYRSFFFLFPVSHTVLKILLLHFCV